MMKRNGILILLACVLLFSISGCASSVQRDDISMRVGGQLSSDKDDNGKAIQYNGNVYVPASSLKDAFGANTSYDEGSNTLNISNDFSEVCAIAHKMSDTLSSGIILFSTEALQIANGTYEDTTDQFNYNIGDVYMIYSAILKAKEDNNEVGELLGGEDDGVIAAFTKAEDTIEDAHNLYLSLRANPHSSDIATQYKASAGEAIDLYFDAQSKISDFFKNHCAWRDIDWVFISHHHNDHCGLVERILPGIPILSGEETHRILDVISDFTDSPRPEIYLHFKSGQPIQLDDIRVTPIGVDHSAMDAYMFLIQADRKNVLYTGDYRAADQIPAQIRQLLGGQKLDVLISEGTNIRAEKQSSNTPQNEKQVEQRACELMMQYSGTVFVLCSSTNEERIRAMHRAAKAVGRTVCEDLFLTAVRTQREENALRFVAHYTSKKKTPRTYAYFQRYFQRYFERHELLGAESLAKLPGKKVVFVRTSMLPFLKNYLACCPDRKNLLLYSIWQGYRESRPVKELLAFCDAHGIEVADLHCSGHASRSAIQELIRTLNPQFLIPIHCEAQDRGEFEAFHPNCLMVRDGERWEV